MQAFNNACLFLFSFHSSQACPLSLLLMHVPEQTYHQHEQASNSCEDAYNDDICTGKCARIAHAAHSVDE